MKMRKIVAGMMAVLMLCCIIPFSAVAEDATATIDFTDKANRTSYSTEQQVWAQNGITVTNDKAASTSNVGDYGGEGYPARFYQNSSLKIEYPGMTKIVFNVDDYKASYPTALESSIQGADVSVDGFVVTVTLPAAADSFVIEALSAQVRVDSIAVYAASAEPDVPVTPEVPENAIEYSNYDDGEKQGWASSSDIRVEDGILIFECTKDWANVYKYANGMKANTDYVYTFRAKANMNSTMNIKINDNWAADSAHVKFDVTTEWQEFTVDVNSGDYKSAPILMFSVNVPASTGMIFYLDYVVISEKAAEPVVPSDPEVDTELSIADAIALGASKEHNTYTEGKYFVTGVITEVYNTQYGNMKITDEAGNILTVYGTYSADGTVRYDALEVKPVAGDTVTVYGIIGQYNGTPQVKNGWITAHTAAETPDEPDVPVEPDVPASDLILIDAPKAGVAYKFGMIQGNVSATDVYYLKGGMNGYYMDTAADAAAAIDVYLEETDGGYYMYTLVDGAKTYINMVVSGTHVNGAYEAAASTVYTFNAESKTVIAIVNDAEYWFGTRNDKTYTTVGPCAVSYAGFYCQFYGTAETPDAPVVPDEPDTPVEPDVPASDLILIDAPKAGVAYKFGMIQGNVSATDVYYLKGGMNGYYMDTAADAAAAIDVYLEEAAGGYYMYTLVDGAKTYINMVVSGTHVNGAYEAAASTVYTFNAESKTVIAIVNDAEYWFGTRNDKTYTTVGPCAVSYAGFYCQFYGAAETPDVPVEPDEPEVPSDPAADSVLTIPQANELGLSKEKNTYTEGKYYVTGKIVAISNATYGNMYIVDENNNQFMVYGAYSADGEIRFDALEYIPVVGDTVTVYGIIGTYNGTEAQMKNGWITEIVKGEGEPENTDPAADSVLTVKEAIELGLSKLHNVFTENKYYVTAEITEIYNDIYGNMYVKDAEGNVLTIYGTYDADGTNRFDAMENKPVVGDTVKLYGIVGQYNGNPQMKNAWIVAINPEAPVDPEEPSEPSDPEEPSEPDAPVTPDEPGTDSPETGDNSTVYVTLAVILMALAAAATVITKKRA